MLTERSLTSVTESWSAVSDQASVPTQWLTQVALALAEDLGGLLAVTWVFTASLLALVLLLHAPPARTPTPCRPPW